MVDTDRNISSQFCDFRILKTQSGNSGSNEQLVRTADSQDNPGFDLEMDKSKPNLIKVDTKPNLIKVHTKPNLNKVYTKPNLIKVHTKPNLIKVHTKPNLINVHTKTNLVKLQTKPNLIKVHQTKPDQVTHQTKISNYEMNLIKSKVLICIFVKF